MATTLRDLDVDLITRGHIEKGLERLRDEFAGIFSAETVERFMAESLQALGDPVRLQLVDVLRKHAGKVCVCELVPLFEISQPTLSHHLKKLRDAGIVDSERRGLWAYYYVLPGALEELTAWLS